MKTLFVSLMIFLPFTASSSPQDKLMTYVNQTIDRTTTNMEMLTQIQDSSATSSFGLKRVLVRVQGIFGFQVPIFASFKAVPEVEFVFQKESQ